MQDQCECDWTWGEQARTIKRARSLLSGMLAPANSSWDFVALVLAHDALPLKGHFFRLATISCSAQKQVQKEMQEPHPGAMFSGIDINDLKRRLCNKNIPPS